MDTWVAMLVVIGSSICWYSDFRWRKLFASIIENFEKDTAEIGRQQGIIWTHEDTIRDHKEQIAERDDTIHILRMEYDQLHAADKLLKNDLTMTINELNAMTLERDRLLVVIKLRDEKIDKLNGRTNELNAQIDGLKYKFETRGGQVPDLNAAWHTKENPVDVKQQYLLDDTPLDDSGSGVIDSQPYGE